MEELVVRQRGVALAASYSPAGDTAVVALHSASAATRDDPLYSHLHELLPPAGIGVVTFDRRGEGESTGEPSRGRFELQVEDALAVLTATDTKRVGLWGISQGGWIGPLAAVASSDVAFLVLIASTGVTPSEQMVYAVERQLRLAGYGDDVVARALETTAPEPDEQLAAELSRATDYPWWPQAWLPASLLDEQRRLLWIEEMDFDPARSSHRFACRRSSSMAERTLGHRSSRASLPGEPSE
jgi:pimeloyl-ACP methyl ester carboxylesterase